MGSKWDALRGKYPRLRPEAGYQEKLDTIMDSPAPKDILGPTEEDLELSVRMLSDFQLHKLYLKVRDEIDAHNAALSPLNLELEAYTQLLADRMLEDGKTSQSFEGGVTIAVNPDAYPTVKDQPKLLNWVRESNQEALLTLNYQTLASLTKSRLENGQESPPGVEVYVKDKLSCRGRKKDG